MSGQSATKSLGEVKAAIKAVQCHAPSGKGGSEMNQQSGNKKIGKK